MTKELQALIDNEELKKKIAEVIDNWANTAVKVKKSGASVYDPYNAAELADALIAAGIGDVKDLQAQVNALEMTNIALQAGYDGAEKDRLYWVDKYKEAEQRAARVEMALDLCETAYILSLNHRATEGISGQAIASDLGVHKFFMEQAEKELAELKGGNEH